MQLSISVGYAVGPAIGGALQEVHIYISQSSACTYLTQEQSSSKVVMTADGDSVCYCLRFVTVRVCHSHVVSVTAIWIGWRRQSAVNMLSRYLT